MCLVCIYARMHVHMFKNVFNFTDGVNIIVVIYYVALIIFLYRLKLKTRLWMVGFPYALFNFNLYQCWVIAPWAHFRENAVRKRAVRHIGCECTVHQTYLRRLWTYVDGGHSVDNHYIDGQIIQLAVIKLAVIELAIMELAVTYVTTIIS